jgi:deoxycytidine triphosphate deaminase
MVDYRVVPSVWRAGNHVYLRGDVVPEATLARLGPVSSWRRLGFIVPTGQPDPVWWEGMTKTQIIAAAADHNVEVDRSLTKKQIIEQLKQEDPDGV